jgi:nucleoside-diphosphate-sugar epimerase
VTRIIVTGGAGRLGRSLVAGLAGVGHEIVSLDRAVSDAPELADVAQVAVDLTDPDAAARAIAGADAEALVHLAAIAVPFSAPEDVILRTNAALALNVLSSGVAAGIPRIVTASSPTVLGYGAPTGWLPDRFPLDEETAPKPWNAYALSKHLAEQTIAMLARQTGDATRFAAFRPCYVIAPEEWQGAPTQQGHTVRERLDDPALSAPALFNYVDARDVASFIDVLLDALPAIPNAEVFFVGADDALAREPLADLLPRFVPGSGELAAVLTGTSPAFSNAKARRVLGWQPHHTWRDELVSADQTPADQTRKDAPAWTSTASSSSP